MIRLGVVSFLNSRPLIEGLEHRAGVECVFDVPARLPRLLDQGAVDAALVPVVDLLRSDAALAVVSDGCIGCDGETMTVRIFSQVPPDRIRSLRLDSDSHTSVALARILWRELYDRELNLEPFDPRQQPADQFESVLLIGDKVVDPARGRFAYEVDLGGAWRQHTGLPFVFAVWACRAERLSAARRRELSELLSAARDRGVRRAAEIADVEGPRLGWPVELARRYLTRCLLYRLDQRCVAGANLFAQRCAELGIVPAGAEIAWPSSLLAGQCV